MRDDEPVISLGESFSQCSCAVRFRDDEGNLRIPVRLTICNDATGYDLWWTLYRSKRGGPCGLCCYPATARYKASWSVVDSTPKITFTFEDPPFKGNGYGIAEAGVYDNALYLKK